MLSLLYVLFHVIAVNLLQPPTVYMGFLMVTVMGHACAMSTRLAVVSIRSQCDQVTIQE